MKNLSLFLIIIVGITFSCKPDEEVIPVSDPNLKWEDSFSEVVSAASTIKINFQLTNSGTLHYIISEEEILNINADYIRSHAGAEASQGIAVSGFIEVKPKDVGDTLEIIVPGLVSGKTYYTYTLSEAATDNEDFEHSVAIIKQFASKLKLRQEVKDITSTVMNKKMNYLSYALEDYYLNPDKKYPLLIFLHGMGEYAAEGEINLYRNTTIPELIKKGNDYPFIVISPQLNTGSWSPDFVEEVINAVTKNYRVDESRIYMTGISLGGIGTWNYATTYPEKLAAIVPISGSGSTSKACNMYNIPVWAFHNSSDGLVNTSGSVNMINALKECATKCPEEPALTLYPDAGHNAWVRTYNGSAGHDIFSWFLNHQR